MLTALYNRIFGDKRQRTFRKLKPLIDESNRHFDFWQNLSDDELRAKTQHFRDRLALGETVDDLLPEAFAAVKLACKRLCGKTWEAAGSDVTWDMVPFDVQLAGGIELHRGNIAEMATGEGKTLVAVAPLYLNALEGKGAHLVTVNDYLAKRDSQWMGKVFEFLGLSVGCILTDMEPEERRQSYACDITYGTNNEFGFDYLRDNMALSAQNLVQRGYHYAIVDEARTPLIISGAVDRSIHQYDQFRPIVAELVKRQTFLVNGLVQEAEEFLAKSEAEGGRKGEDAFYEAGVRLLRARRGHPKHKRLFKVTDEARIQRLIERVENDYMRDKRMGEIDDALYFAVDEKQHTVDLMGKGREALSPDDPEMFVVPDMVEVFAEIEAKEGLTRAEREKLKEKAMADGERKSETIHSLAQLLKAYVLYERDVEYVIQENKIIIVDENTGRLMPGRRWSDGLHQAVEAKEGVQVEKETQTLATITLQNYFRMYGKLAGMTGTAETEAGEFAHTYRMDVAVIPTNRPIRRLDDEDLIYKTEREKFNAVIERIEEIRASGMPTLIGTISVEASEKLSRMLQRAKISHNVLNAKQHAREAEIVREAGKSSAVTIATNMAGRGTDIKLGPGVVRCRAEGFSGSCCALCPKAKEEGLTVDPEMVVCGLHIIGTERHEARRIDRQLRGRAGRQGDPGYSQFFVSLEDNLMRLFASDRMAALMSKGFEEGEAMSHGIATRAITTAQKRIEDMNFERRKNTLKYDDVMNKQRKAVYGFRREILMGEGALDEQVMRFAHDALDAAWELHGGYEEEAGKFDPEGFVDYGRRSVPMANFDGLDPAEADSDRDAFFDKTIERMKECYEEKTKVFGEQLNGALSRFVMLNIIDNHWRDHLLAIDVLREGIYLRSYGQLDPLTEYQREATILFEDMMREINKEIFEHVFRATIVQEPTQEASHVTYEKAETAPPPASADPEAQDGAAQPPAEKPKGHTVRRQTKKVGRNEPCPCGSGKKYKNCHGVGEPKSGPTAG